MARAQSAGERLPDPDFPKGRSSHEDHQHFLAAGLDRAVPPQTVFAPEPRSSGHRSRIRGVRGMHGTRRLMARAANVPAMWARRLLRQIKEQARPRTFPSQRPSLDPALQGARDELGVVLCGRGPSRSDLTNSFPKAYVGSPATGELTGSTQVTGITKLEPPPASPDC